MADYEVEITESERGFSYVLKLNTKDYVYRIRSKYVYKSENSAKSAARRFYTIGRIV